jgi:hypothetical protein
LVSIHSLQKDNWCQFILWAQENKLTPINLPQENKLTPINLPVRLTSTRPPSLFIPVMACFSELDSLATWPRAKHTMSAALSRVINLIMKLRCFTLRVDVMATVQSTCLSPRGRNLPGL